MKERFTIAVADASPGCGASFICGLLAAQKCRTESVSLVELGKPYFYAALGMDRRFSLRSFQSYVKMLESGKGIRSISNMDEKVNWILLRPEEKAPEGPELFRLISSVPGETVIFDCSGVSDELLKQILPEMDKVYMAVDPLPTKLLGSYRRLEIFRLLLPEMELVVNKMNSGVHKSELRRFLGSRNFSELPLVDPSILYKAEYNCLLPSYFLGEDPRFVL